MFIDRKQLAEIISQEVRFRLRELAERDGEGDRKRSKKPETTDAEDSPSPRGDVPAGPRATGDQDVEDEPQDPGPHADDQDPDADDALDPEGEAGEEPSGAVNNDLAGKTVQAISIEPQSKILPGAKEIVISFKETSDPLRILITATGQAKFFLKGQLHDLP